MAEISHSTDNEGQIVLYQPNDSISLEVRLDTQLETVWLTQQQIADLFGVKQPAISKHLNNIFREGELDKDSVHSILEYTDFNDVIIRQSVIVVLGLVGSMIVNFVQPLVAQFEKFGDLFAESHRLEAGIREKLAGIGFSLKEG